MPVETEKDVRSPAPRANVPLEPHLFVVLESGRPSGGGLRCSLNELHEVSLVRGDVRGVDRPAASERLVLAIPDRRISGCHARLVRGQGGWRVEDQGSTNGTFVNGQRVTSHGLADGDLLEVGHALLRFRRALPTPEGTAPISSGQELREAIGLGTTIPALARDLAQIARVARATVPVLLLGDTGTGKELVARAVHDASGRRGAFVAVNCAALPDALVEAQLFGHTKGAFSGALRDELGFVRAADGGTLFLDEVGDLPASAQGVLLRVLQQGEVVPVGATRPQLVDLRVVAATHQSLEQMMDRGAFRRDLFGRLQGYTHRLWRLADRIEDLGLLVAELLARFQRGKPFQISPDAACALVRYPWPLNVRELAQALSHAAALSDDSLEVAHLPPSIAFHAEESRRESAPIDGLSLPDQELRGELLKRLDSHGGNVAAIARDMGKAPMQIYRWMQRLGINADAYRGQVRR